VNARKSAPGAQGLYDPAHEHDACGVGFVAHLKGQKSHQIVKGALQILVNLEHRGACGCEANTGDGAGILLQVPHAYLKKAAGRARISLPDAGHYGVGMVFLPQSLRQRRSIEKLFEDIIAAEGQKCLGWRTVPTRNATLGETARSEEPVVRQIFIRRGEDVPAVGEGDPLAFERKLYVIRRRAENEIHHSGLPGADHFYISSLSSRTIVYKGMLTTAQVAEFYPELNDPLVESGLAIVHSRFSTNTFPSWNRSHPYRMIAHNGEINTLRGNVNWMRAREAVLTSTLFGDDMQKLLPIIQSEGSDSAMFDNCLEMLVLAGRSPAHAVMMMIPEPWSNHESMSDEKKAFYEYHACLMEPWDGPASITFTDGEQIGAVLDRNGLRPSRYYVTKDNLVIMASEVGVLDVAPENVAVKGRLQPGRMFLVDTREGRIIADEEIKKAMASSHPYREWLKQNLVPLENLPKFPVAADDDLPLVTRQHAFGYTFEDLNLILGPMAKNGIEPVGSMGNDTPLAVLSDKPQLLYNYFKQLFAQVTNPPIDSIREEIITSSETYLGSEGNLVDPQPESCRMIKLKHPILTNEELARLKNLQHPDFKTATLSILFDPKAGEDAMKAALHELFVEADRLIASGVNLLILSDRGINSERVAIPALLAVAGLHHHLVAEGTRTRAGLVLESGEPREVHHFALLVGYGAGAINPYLALDSLKGMIQDGLLEGVDPAKAEANFVKAAAKGIVKTMSKMGISTVQSYRGAQIFEAVGLSGALVDDYFKGTPTRVEGATLDVIQGEALTRHSRAFPPVSGVNQSPLEAAGFYKWRNQGEEHMFNPETIHFLQVSCRSKSYDLFKEYSKRIDEQAARRCTLRGMMEFKFPERGVPIEEVESVEEIVKRFKTGAMSYGSISKEAHETLAIAMNRLGGKSNTGEGGEDADRLVADANGDSRNSAIKQVASGRFGVTSQYLVSAKEIQIKMAQGAKPGEGGQLPGTKVYPWVAKTRHSTPGVGLISPPPHHDIYSIEDLAELIHDLKNANRHARISVKLVSEVGVGTVAAGVAKAHADVVLISGYDGGTGASPLSSIKHAGAPWELGLAETHQTLLLNNLRSRIVVEVDGQLKTGRDLAVAALLGGEEFGFATAPLVVSGCIMMRACHLNTCPVGIATQNPVLRKKYSGKPEYVETFMKFVAQELREIMARLGFRTLNEMIGRCDLLDMRKSVDHWKASGLDLSKILYQPDVPSSVGRYCQMKQDHGIEQSLDMQVLMKLCDHALKDGKTFETTLPIRNTNRVVGTILGSELTKEHGGQGLPDDTIKLRFQGSAGQSFGAFVPRGITLELEGDANDYVGKGLSGGKIIIYPPSESTFDPRDNIICGNVAFYGATSGEAYIRGMAGERFCVRNSGVTAVIDSVGDHGCEYMTGGRVVILGPTGRNFAAGMSGGVAYVLDAAGDFASRCNQQMVGLSPVTDPEEIAELRRLVQRYAEATRSEHGARLLALWDEVVPKFVKVLPKDYQRMLEAIARVKARGLSGDEAVMEAFEENSRDLARVGGN
jgi:glutamate synthase (ferredoxin)